jgi:hypothetical protein
MKRYKYPYSRYNRFDVVRVNAFTAAAVLFLSRHVLTFLVIGIAFSRAQPDSKSAFSGLFEPVFMLADIPALPVLLAMFARHPKSGRLLRVAWRCGPWLLLASAAIYLGLLFRHISDNPAPHGWIIWAMISGTILSIAYVFLSPYARDLFRQFPDRSLAEDETGKS